jgi:hypothetical protein
MLSQKLDLLDGFIQISDQGTDQLHLISEASHTVVISSSQYHNFRSFFNLAQDVAVLLMRHSLILFMPQNYQRFSGCLSHACLEHPPQCRCLDHLLNEANMIGHRPLIDDHTTTPKIRVPTKQPCCFDEERGFTRTQR